MAKRVVLPAMLPFLLLLGGCPPVTTPSNEKTDSKLIAFDSENALLAYFRDQATQQTRARTHTGWFFWAVPGGMGDVNQETADAAGDAADYSTTNLQEAGVDEGDVFKSDGTYFYIGKDDTLRIVQASPAESLAEVARLALPANVQSLYLADKTVLALCTDWGEYLYGAEIWPPYYSSATLTVVQIDVTDPANPTITHSLELDGSLVSSRVTNGRLLLVLTIMPALPDRPTEAAINEMTLAEIMPRAQAAGGDPVQVIPWNNWLHPEAPDGCGMTGIVTLDAANVETIVDSVAVLASAGTIYASENALYLTNCDYDPSNNYRENTVVHKFAFGDDGAARYSASGTVPGRLLNQFSLGEYEGNLRVATHLVGDVTVFWTDALMGAATSSDGTGSEPDNAVFVLGQTGETLEILGSVGDFGTDEQIYAVRFIADHAFVVTYEQVDPLFVIDLADPRQPRLVGELQAPGFSDYLHPLGTEYLIGVGRATDQTVWGGTGVKGIQLSLFNVSDWTNPQIVQQVSLGSWGSSSEISYDHKAFTLIEHDGQTLIAIPVVLTTDGDTYGWEFAGIICYRVDTATGFTELGRVASVGQQVGWWPQWQRGAFISDAVYALTPDGLRTAPLSEFNATHEMSFAD